MSTTLILFLIDETEAMAVAAPTSQRSSAKKTKAELLCTLINARLNKLSEQSDVALSIVGYQADSEGNHQCGTRWQGPLEKHNIINTSQLSSGILRTEQRTRKLPQGGEQTFDFPVWYEMEPKGKGDYAAALATCKDLMDEWANSTSQPNASVILCHIHAGDLTNICDQAGQQVMAELITNIPEIQVLQIRLAESEDPTEILFPRGPAHLPLGVTRELLDQTTLLSDALVSALKDQGFAINDRVKGLIFNASFKSISQTISAIGCFASPATEQTASSQAERNEGSQLAETESSKDSNLPIQIEGVLDESTAVEPPTEDSGNPNSNQAICFVFDRGTIDTNSDAAAKAVQRIQVEANYHLQQLTKMEADKIDIAVLVYGTKDGQTEVLSPIMQDAKKIGWASNDSLEEQAIRTEETEEQIPNGAGGLLTIPRKNMIFLDHTATEKSDPRPAFKQAAAMISTWQASHPNATAPPLVLHFTSGSWDNTMIEEAAKNLGETDAELILYHHVATEQPHPSAAYPESETGLEQPSLATAWHCTSPLGNANGDQNSSNLSESSRGMVVNGKFDLLMEAIQGASANLKDT